MARDYDRSKYAVPFLRPKIRTTGLGMEVELDNRPDGTFIPRECFRNGVETTEKSKEWKFEQARSLPTPAPSMLESVLGEGESIVKIYSGRVVGFIPRGYDVIAIDEQRMYYGGSLREIDVTETYRIGDGLTMGDVKCPDGIIRFFAIKTDS